MTSFYGERKVDRIIDAPKNDSRMTVSYIIVNNDSLGGGGFGEVFLVQKEKENVGDQQENQPLFAMKRIKKDGIINDKNKLHRVLTEIKIHRSLNNKYICKYEHSFEDKNSIYILMEYCEKKSLDDYLKTRKTLTEYETRYYMYQVLLALKYLRRQKVIHRDLTIANLFMKDYKTIKIGDFGLSYKETENEEKQDLICGTQGYFTPESRNSKYSYKTDIFDFGVCIYHLMTGNTLFKDSISSYDSIQKHEIIYDDKTKFSSEVKDLFNRIFVMENTRIDLEEIYQHSFFNKGEGLIDVDFPDFFKIPKKDFDEKIKALEQKVKMTNVSCFPRKNTLSRDGNYNYSNNKNGNESKQTNNKSLNESTQGNTNNKSRELGLNDSIKNIGVTSNKKLIDLSRNKFSLNIADNSENSDDISNNLDKNKRIRVSLKIKKDDEEKIDKDKNSRKKGGNKKLTFLLSDESKSKRDKIINESLKEDNNLREKLEQNLEKLKKDNKIINKNFSDEPNTFKLRQSTKSLDMNICEEEEEKKEEQKEEEKEKEIKEEEEEEEEKGDIYILKIIEISEKYGIAYELSNKDIGILFNDFSHITKFKKIKNLVYYLNNNIQKRIVLPLKNERDADLVNKIYYLGYIIDELKRKKNKKKSNNNDMEENKNNNSNNNSNNSSFDSKIIDENNVKIHKKNVYLMKYKKNSYAYFFILSNKTIQIDYYDGVKIIFSCHDNKKIIYINKKGIITNFELKDNEDFANFKCEDPKINKRIKYAIKEIKK